CLARRTLLFARLVVVGGPAWRVVIRDHGIGARAARAVRDRGHELLALPDGPIAELFPGDVLELLADDVVKRQARLGLEVGLDVLLTDAEAGWSLDRVLSGPVRSVGSLPVLEVGRLVGEVAFEEIGGQGSAVTGG